MPYQNKILDAGQLKSINHYNMYKHPNKWDLQCRYTEEYGLYEKQLDYNLRYERGEFVDSAEQWKRVNRCFHMRYEPNVTRMKPMWELSDKELFEYYNIIPYKPCWMLNISPAWKGNPLKQNADTVRRVAFIREVMNIFYSDASRFSKMVYVMEGGKEANFLHIHAVFELNSDKPNNIAHMKKGNFLKSFRTIWDATARGRDIYNKWEGVVGSKYALQTTYLTTPQMLQDKLDYLIEEKKPPSHQNHPDFKSIRVGKWD